MFVALMAFSVFAAFAYVLSNSNYAVENVVRKTHLWFIGVLQMLLSQDKKGKIKVDAGKVKLDATSTSKRVIFIRHGESEWNEVFNRGFGPSFVVRLVKAALRELLMVTTRDSVFFDSPLSATGVRQTSDMIRFLQKTPTQGAGTDPKVAEVVAILRGEASDPSVVGTSNLRRAIATGLIGMWDRLRRTGESFHVLTCLQEITFNIDGISLLEKGEGPDPSLAKELGGEIVFGADYNYGTKSWRSTGVQRMADFSAWCFGRQENTIVVAGHSLYFRSFFKAYLPLSSSHISKSKKMVNCGVVAFTLQRGTHQGKVAYKIDPDSIVTVYGGFEGAKAKKV